MKGRTYRYYTADPLYPFGYGLSYSTFTYSNLTLSASTIEPGQQLDIMVSIKNNGSSDAEEVLIFLLWLHSLRYLDKSTNRNFFRKTGHFPARFLHQKHKYFQFIVCKFYRLSTAFLAKEYVTILHVTDPIIICNHSKKKKKKKYFEFL